MSLPCVGLNVGYCIVEDMKMLDSTAFITFAIALLAGAAMPGPAIAAVVARILGEEEQSAWPYASGIICGDVAWLTIAIAGLATLAKSHDMALTILKYAGACYLLLLAYRTWTDKSDLKLVEDARRHERGAIASFLAGLVLELGNPKTIAFYLAIMPALFEAADTSAVTYLALLLCAIFIYFAVFAAYISLARRSRRLVRTQARRKWIRRTSAVALAATAVAVATR